MQFQTTKVERTTRAGVAEILYLAGTGVGLDNGGAEPDKEMVVVTLQAVDSFHNLVLDLFKDGGCLDEALRVCELRLGRDIRECGEDSVEAGLCMRSVSTVYQTMGEYTKALEYAQRALGILQRKDAYVSHAMNSIGLIYDDMGDYDQALEYQEKHLEMVIAEAGVESVQLIAPLNNIAGVYCTKAEHEAKPLKAANLAKALESYQGALDLLVAHRGMDHPGVATVLNNMSTVTLDQGDCAKALEYGQKALGIRLKHHAPDHPDVGVSYGNMAGIYNKQGEHTKALEFTQKDTDILLKAVGADHIDVGNRYNDIAHLHKKLGDYSEALKYCQKGLDVKLKTLHAEHRLIGISFKNMAEIYTKQGDYAKALEYYQKELDIKIKLKVAPDHPSVAKIEKAMQKLRELQAETAA
jgi:tetratricopeptide (TPR) repeat protein